MPQKKVKYKVCRDCPDRGPQPISHFYVKEKRKFATRYFSRCKWCYYKYVYGKDKKAGLKWHGIKQKHGRARYIVNLEILTGRLKKPKRCSRCRKKTPSRQLHGHHDDYRCPRKVRWLCHNCHKSHHAH